MLLTSTGYVIQKTDITYDVTQSLVTSNRLMTSYVSITSYPLTRPGLVTLWDFIVNIGQQQNVGQGKSYWLSGPYTNNHRRRVSGTRGLSPPPQFLNVFILCFDSHNTPNAISRELKIYVWSKRSTQCSSVNRLSSLVKHCWRLVYKQRAACSERPIHWTNIRCGTGAAI